MDLTKAELCKYFDYYVNLCSCWDEMSKASKQNATERAQQRKQEIQMNLLFLHCVADSKARWQFTSVWGSYSPVTMMMMKMAFLCGLSSVPLKSMLGHENLLWCLPVC